MVPATRKEFKEAVLRRIGKPVIQINVSDDQVEDRIDYSLKYFADYHFDGSDKIYYKAQITPTDMANRYFTLPDNILGAVNVFPLGESLTSSNLFNIRYQIALNDLYDLTSTTMVPYYMAMQHIQFMELMLVGNQPIRFNRHMNRLYIDADWTRMNVGDYVVVEAYQVVDPDQFVGVWGDRWLIRYVTAQVKEQWGSNLTKYQGVALPGGMQFNGQKIYDDAVAEIAKLEAEMINTYSIPANIFIG